MSSQQQEKSFEKLKKRIGVLTGFVEQNGLKLNELQLKALHERVKSDYLRLEAQGGLSPEAMIKNIDEIIITYLLNLHAQKQNTQILTTATSQLEKDPNYQNHDRDISKMIKSSAFSAIAENVSHIVKTYYARKSGTILLNPSDFSRLSDEVLDSAKKISDTTVEVLKQQVQQLQASEDKKSPARSPSPQPIVAPVSPKPQERFDEKKNQPVETASSSSPVQTITPEAQLIRSLDDTLNELKAKLNLNEHSYRHIKNTIAKLCSDEIAIPGRAPDVLLRIDVPLSRELYRLALVAKFDEGVNDIGRRLAGKDTSSARFKCKNSLEEFLKAQWTDRFSYSTKSLTEQGITQAMDMIKRLLKTVETSTIQSESDEKIKKAREADLEAMKKEIGPKVSKRLDEIELLMKQFKLDPKHTPIVRHNMKEAMKKLDKATNRETLTDIEQELDDKFTLQIMWARLDQARIKAKEFVSSEEPDKVYAALEKQIRDDLEEEEEDIAIENIEPYISAREKYFDKFMPTQNSEIKHNSNPASGSSYSALSSQLGPSTASVSESKSVSVSSSPSPRPQPTNLSETRLAKVREEIKEKQTAVAAARELERDLRQQRLPEKDIEALMEGNTSTKLATELSQLSINEAELELGIAKVAQERAQEVEDDVLFSGETPTAQIKDLLGDELGQCKKAVKTLTEKLETLKKQMSSDTHPELEIKPGSLRFGGR